MKKKLVLFSMLICSMFCLFACNKDPYKNMTIETSASSSQIQLNIEDVGTPSKSDYKYDSYSFDVKVGNVGSDVNKEIRVSGGQDLVDCEVVYKGSGISTITVTPKSYDKSGNFKLVIKTVEGNKSISLDFNVDLKINNFFLNQESLNVIAKGQTIDFKNITKYVDFLPAKTSQTDIKFEVVRPNVEGKIPDYPTDNNYVYNVENTEKYAEVIGDKLVTYKNVEYPKLIKNVTTGEEFNQVYTQCITLKASYVGKEAYVVDENGIEKQRISDRYIDILVLEDCDNVSLRMNCQKNESSAHEGDINSFELEKNANGEYEVVLLKPNFINEFKTYYIDRDLTFDLGEISDENGYNPNDYVVTTTNIDDAENCPVIIKEYAERKNSFNIKSQKAGTYRHVFKVDNVNYPGIVNKDIVVNFVVKEVPNEIKVNGSIAKDLYKIYKNYGSSYGTRFTIGLKDSKDYTYFVFLKDNDLLGDKLKMYTNDGTEQIFAKQVEENGFKVIKSTKDGVNYSNFASNNTFYLRHNFDTLPEETKQFYIGIAYDVTSKSYSEEVRLNYFEKEYLEFPINIAFETGISDIKLEETKLINKDTGSYMIDATNQKYTNGILDSEGIKLFSLPKGISFESVFNVEDIVYDKSLVSVYYVYDEVEEITSVYLKCNSNLKLGSTDITIKTKNNIRKSLNVTTFIPTAYAENENLDEFNKMPLGLNFDEDETLYYFTGKNEYSPKDTFALYKTTEGNGQQMWGQYLSLQRLFMLTNSSVGLKFYDYLLTEESGQKVVTPIDITNQVKISINSNQYARYVNGRLYCFNNVTEDKTNPIEIRVSYTGGYIKINDEGQEEYVKYQIDTLLIHLFVYFPLQGVQVTTSKNVDIYVSESLGAFNQDLSKHEIISDFIPNEKRLGAQWNDDWPVGTNLPVDLSYDVNQVLNSPIYLSNGKALVIYSLDGSLSRALYYRDLFYTDNNGIHEYTCPIYCKINNVSTSQDEDDSLDYWIRNKSGYTLADYDWFVQNKIFNHDIVMTINVYITQFSKLQNINSVKFNAKYADRISEFDIDVADDGVYFEKRNNETKLEQSISYRINVDNVVSKDIVLINPYNRIFSATCEYDPMGTSGRIVINIANKEAGIGYLTAVPKDNIKTFNSETGEYTYYNNSLVQTFRVKVADGSVELPFEIRNVKDYESMQEDIANNDYYYYTLATNINLKEVTNGQASFCAITDGDLSKFKNFNLNGQHSYKRNGVEITKNFGLYNLYLNKTINVNSDTNIGLFGRLNQKVTIQNLTLSNVIINLTIKSFNSNGSSLNVGMLAGTARGARIINSQVSGSINIINASNDAVESNVNIGGLVGKAQDLTISGLPINYQSGVSTSAYNANVSINYSNITNANGVSNAINNHYFNVGGLIGLSNNDKLMNLNVLPYIKGTNYNSSVGGVVGKSVFGTISNMTVYPVIEIADKMNLPTNVINVSTMVGAGGDTTNEVSQISIRNSKIFFVKEEYTTWKQNLAVIIQSSSIVNYGSIIGNLNKNNAEILYTYVRSFYTQDASDEYYANIFINTTSQSKIGGLVGAINNNVLDIKNSYFNADILTNATKSEESIELNNSVGLLIADTSVGANSEISDSYAIGRIYVIYAVDGQTQISAINQMLRNAGVVVLNNFNEYSGDAIANRYVYATDKKIGSVSNLVLNNVYGVINYDFYYVTYNNNIYGLHEDGKVLYDPNNGIFRTTAIDLFKGGLGYSIFEDDNTTLANNYIWLINSGANRVKDIAFPILLNESKTKALFDLVPERISIDKIRESAGVYDVSYADDTQILMFVNKTSTKLQEKYYTIEVNSEESTISIKFDGETIISRYLEINSDLAITEDSNSMVIRVVGNSVMPVGEGFATLTISSALDKTVKLNIKIKVVEGITDIQLKNVENVTLVEEKGQDIPVVYIDESSLFEIKNINLVDSTEYLSSNEYYYLLKISEIDDSLRGEISINGKNYTYDSENANNNTFILKTTNLNIKGVRLGYFKFKITAVIDPNDVQNNLTYISPENTTYKKLSVSREFEIKICARARRIETSRSELKIAPNNTTDFKVVVETSNVLITQENGDYYVSFLKTMEVLINARRYNIAFSDRYLANYEDGVWEITNFQYEIDYRLIDLTFDGISIVLTDRDSASNKYTYKVTFDVDVSFDIDYYKANANDYDLNLVKFNYVFTPLSNENLKANIEISISPNVLTGITTHYYSRGELLKNSEGEIFPSENVSKFVIPGCNGLLKITLDEEINDSSYITVTLNKSKYAGLVRLSQMAGQISSIIGTGDYTNYIDYIDSYKDVSYRQEINTEEEFGIRLSKMSLNYNDLSYFGNTYFVKLWLNRDYGDLKTIDIKINSYKVEANGNIVSQSIIVSQNIEEEISSDPNTITLDVAQLPNLDVKVDNLQSSVLGKGVKKPLEISYSGVTQNIDFSINVVNKDGSRVKDNSNKRYIVDENGETVFKELDIDYLNAGKQYYLCADIDSDIVSIEISFSVNEIVMGVRENAKSILKINIVEFEIENIIIDNSINGVVTIKHGQSFIVNTKIEFKKLTVGDPTKIKAYEQKLKENGLGLVHMAEYASAGVSIIEKSTNTEILSSNLNNRLAYLKVKNNEKRYEPMQTGVSMDYIKLDESSSEIDNYIYHYYIIKGTAITGNNNVSLRLYVYYHYNDGKLVVDSGEFGYLPKEIDFQIVVEDGSSYDHPNPIENAEDLIVACNANGGNYILLNNIELENWVPQIATFSSLDGNGYVIKIKSFNLTGVIGSDSVNVGIFSNVNSGVLLKNITVDISEMLITENKMLEQIDKVKNANKDSYTYPCNIDLSFVKKVNFGILAGTNEGSITNAKIINTLPTTNIDSTSKISFHVVTTQGSLDNTLVESNIGGLVGENTSTGAITNSFVGLNKASMDNNRFYVEYVGDPSSATYNNENDKMTSHEIYSFMLAGGNNLAGLVSKNSGIISNSYAKGVGLYNTYPAVLDSKTGGLVADNLGTITSAFVESRKIGNYRAIEDKFIIESTGNVGGLVYSNSGIIENAYSDVYLETQSAFSGEFVFINNEGASISNSYTTSYNRNSLAHGKFSGIQANGRDTLNYGTYTNCYYLALENESVNSFETATAIDVTTSTIGDKNTWQGFSFTTKANTEGIWILSETTAPQLASSSIDTYSFRSLSEVEEIKDGEESYTIYNYEYIGYALGSDKNPLIIDKAENFDKYIIDNAVAVNGKIIFGAGSYSSGNVLSQMNTIRNVRLVNNLDFDNESALVNPYKNAYLYQTIFAGVLDGNGMTLDNLKIGVSNLDEDSDKKPTTLAQLENFGLFAEIGVKSDISTEQAIIKNLNINLSVFTPSSDTSRVGILAGTITNANIINVKIDGGSANSDILVVRGRNMAGALAGLIQADESGSVSLFDVEISNVTIESTYGSLGGGITGESQDKSNGFYNKFSIINDENPNQIENRSFISLYDNQNKITKLTDNEVIRKDVSYAGGVAGVIIANNYQVELSEDKIYKDYRTNPDNNTIDNVVVKGKVKINKTDNAGGLFGYVSENTLIKKSKFVVGDEQSLIGYNYVGGIVAENHGVIEQCYVAMEDSVQQTYDNNIFGTDQTQTTEYQIFNGSSNFAVAIGGIAGYSSNGVILDSYSKANVTKNNAYIAGGLVGYSENYNYIAYSYSTGAVYGKFITGGIVGIQVNSGITEERTNENNQKLQVPVTNNEYLNMYHVYGLTNWNLSLQDNDFRNETTKKLYNRQKVMYQKTDGTYYNFFVKMPEIGNLNIVEDNSKYLENNRDNNYFVGSAIGYAIINVGTDGNYVNNTTQTLIDSEYTQDYKFNASSNVMSNTLGIYSTQGSLSSGNKVDSYFETTFDFDTGNDTTISLYSYKLAYRVETNSVEASLPILNGNIAINIDETKVDDYFDIASFKKIYAQEYKEQMLGAFTVILDSSNKNTDNVFKYEYQETNRFAKRSTDAFINPNNDYIWAMGDYLPMYNNGLFKSQEIIKNEEELIKALTSLSTGKIYKINPKQVTDGVEQDKEDYTLSINITDTDRFVKYGQTIRDSFTGINKAGSNTKPKIKFIVTIDGTEKSKVNSIFNLLNGAIFNNLDIEVFYDNASCVSFENSEKYYNSYGLFANTLQNVTISDCDITLTINQSLEIKKRETTTAVFNSENAGIMFGDINNCVINNTNFKIISQNVTLNAKEIMNFGLFAGKINNSAITNNTFEITNNSTVITLGGAKDSAHTSLNVGGLSGIFNNSTYKSTQNLIFKNSDNSDNKNIWTLTNNCKFNEHLNASLMFGYASNSNVESVSSTEFNVINNVEVKSLNVSQVIAMSTASNISNTQVYAINVIEGTGSQIDTLAVGSMVGTNLRATTLGYNGIVKFNSKINVKAKVYNMYVGGFVGSSTSANSLVELAQFTGDINVINEQIGSEIVIGNNKTTTYACTYVGGILGNSNGLMGMSNVLSAGNISVQTNEDAKCITAVGGLIGVSKSNSNINNFAVLTTITLGNDKYVASNNNCFVSGVIGNNTGLFSGENGFTLVELPNNSGVQTSAITNNSISNSVSNIFYAQEFMGKSLQDSSFNVYALADIYNATEVTINQESNLAQVYAENKFGVLTKIGNLVVILPENTSIEGDFASRELYNPTVLTSKDQINITRHYYVILEDIDLTGVTLNYGQYISGRTTSTGKVTITLNNAEASSSTQYVVNKNEGVISNVYLCTSSSTSTIKNPQGLNLALVNENSGLITNVYVYGITTSEFSLANRNSGRIVRSASATIYVGTEKVIYGLVMTNTVDGLISDCYSANFAYMRSAVAKTDVYGIAKTNLGTVQYANYYIPEIMKYNNLVRDYAQVTKSEESQASGVVYNCENTQVPNWTDTRSTIYTYEDGNAQIKGIKNIEGSVIVKIKMESNKGVNNDLASIVETLKNKDTTSVKFDYELEFYSTEKLSYNILRFDDGDKFASYINSLANGTIPSNTVIMLESKDGNPLQVTIDMKRIDVIPASSMIVATDGVVLQYAGKETLKHEFVRDNYGIIANIEFKNFVWVNNENTGYFAPIINNYSGVVYNIKIDIDKTNTDSISEINGNHSNYVAGIVARNYKGGVINHCSINNVRLYTSKYYNYICNQSEGKVYNCSSSNMTTIGGTSWSGGKNGTGDNDK